MSRAFALAGAPALLILALTAVAPVQSQVIDFETLPSGDLTADEQEISDQYAAYGLPSPAEPGDRAADRSPRIAKAGPPRTAFNGCYDVDTPLPI